MISPIRAGTVGFISAISRSILAIAALGLLGPDEEEEKSGTGGGTLPKSAHQHAYTPPAPLIYQDAITITDLCIYAVGSGLIA